MSSNLFRESQFGWPIAIILLLIEGALSLMFFVGIYSVSLVEYSMASLLTISIFFLFYRMLIVVNDSKILVSFGIGLIRKAFDIDDIENVQIKEIPFYIGWGIRFTPNGTIYNINGSRAIEIKFKHSNRLSTIGSKNAINLNVEIEKRRAIYNRV
jgi:hypothetical protein